MFISFYKQHLFHTKDKKFFNCFRVILRTVFHLTLVMTTSIETCGNITTPSIPQPLGDENVNLVGCSHKHNMIYIYTYIIYILYTYVYNI